MDGASQTSDLPPHRILIVENLLPNALYSYSDHVIPYAFPSLNVIRSIAYAPCRLHLKEPKLSPLAPR